MTIAADYSHLIGDEEASSEFVTVPDYTSTSNPEGNSSPDTEERTVNIANEIPGITRSSSPICGVKIQPRFRSSITLALNPVIASFLPCFLPYNPQFAILVL